MIENGALYISVLIAMVALLVGTEKATKSKFFKYVPTLGVMRNCFEAYISVVK